METIEVLGTLLSLLGIFFVVHTLTRKATDSLLYGRLNNLYLRHVHNRQSKRVDRAWEEGDAERAWDEIADAKLEELSAHYYDTRERALDYLENVEPTRKLAIRLVEVLPRQHRLKVRTKMACLLCKTLQAMLLREDMEDREESEPLFREKVRALCFASAIWITEVIWFAAMWVWNRLDQMPVSLVLLAAVVAVVVAFLPVTRIVRSKSSRANSFLIILAVIFGGLWLYSETRHTGVESVAYTLDEYGLSDVHVQIDYPKWLTMDDIDDCKKPVVALVSDDSLPVMSFLIEKDKVYTKNRDCEWAHPVISTTTPSRQPPKANELSRAGQPP
jgi:hypothetical protein